jgi:hypothetical protein
MCRVHIFVLGCPKRREIVFDGLHVASQGTECVFVNKGYINKELIDVNRRCSLRVQRLTCEKHASTFTVRLLLGMHCMLCARFG